MASEIRNRFTDTEMQIARETDLPELLTHLGYQVRRIGRYHTTAEMDSLRIKDRRTWFRYSQNTGGDAITFLQQFCGKILSGSGGVPSDLPWESQRRVHSAAKADQPETGAFPAAPQRG